MIRNLRSTRQGKEKPTYAALEKRQLLAALTLREAITLANSLPDTTQHIHFKGSEDSDVKYRNDNDYPNSNYILVTSEGDGAGATEASEAVERISLSSQLPTITDRTVISANPTAGTALDFGDETAQPKIELVPASGVSISQGLVLNGKGTTIEGLKIGGFGKNGIIAYEGALITRNYIGTLDGENATANGNYGIFVVGGGDDIRIRSNLISGNAIDGVYFADGLHEVRW